jgi:hypothetical protein
MGWKLNVNRVKSVTGFRLSIFLSFKFLHLKEYFWTPLKKSLFFPNQVSFINSSITNLRDTRTLNYLNF